jgi:hypothetical protein
VASQQVSVDCVCLKGLLDGKRNGAFEQKETNFCPINQKGHGHLASAVSHHEMGSSGVAI